jgi:hypothetical protein
MQASSRVHKFYRKVSCCPTPTLGNTDITYVRAVDNYRWLVQVGLRWQQELNLDASAYGLPSLICPFQRNLVREDGLCDKQRFERLRGPGGPTTTIVFYPESDHEGPGVEKRPDATIQQPFARPVCHV